MEEIRRVEFVDIEKLYEIRANAYSIQYLKDSDSREQSIQKLIDIQKKNTDTNYFYGYYRNGELLASMRLFDYTMNLFGKKVLVGGLASVAVDLLHKKERIAKKMVEYFIQHYRQKGASLTCLYSFRPDFYKKMGFGYGTRTYEYDVAPHTLPRGGEKKGLQFATKADSEEIFSFYTRFAERNHGMIYKDKDMIDMMLAFEEQRILLHRTHNNKVSGLLVFTFKSSTRKNEFAPWMHINEWCYEDKEALLAFTTFLNTQSDQVERIVFQSQDEFFYHLLHDPRNNSEQVMPGLFHASHVVGIGMMVRIINPTQVVTDVENRIFGNNSISVKFVINDTFLEEVRTVTYQFKDGKASLTEQPEEVTVKLDSANFSSLMYGSVSILNLYNYGQIEIDNISFEEKLFNIFQSNVKPICTHSF